MLAGTERDKDPKTDELDILNSTSKGSDIGGLKLTII
jgi:hypothetical protein